MATKMTARVTEKGIKRSAREARVTALREELEATRAEFHAQLARVPEAGWRTKSATTDWTMGELFAHLTWAVEYLPKEVQSARQGKGMFNMPKWLADPLSYWYICRMGRRETRESLGRRYDAGMDAVVALLETIPEGDWERGADFYGEGFHSVEELFHTPAQHLREHLG
jgi:hypothetical protein